MPSTILFIINPKSGTDRVKELKQLIDTHIDKTIFDPQIAFTQYAQHGTLLAQEAIEKGVKYIVAVGGDGSVNDIVKGIYGTDTVLGIVPLGSGNGLARSLQLPLDAVKAISLLNNNRIINIDVANANEHLFVSNAGVGFDAIVTKEFKNSTKRGLKSYAQIIFKHYWKYKELDWEIIIDGKKIIKRAFMVTVANANQLGYNFTIANNAKLDDGLLDVVIIKKHPKLLSGLITLRAFNKTLHKSKFVETYRAKKVFISNPTLSIFQTDGDYYPIQTSVEVKIMPKKLKVFN